MSQPLTLHFESRLRATPEEVWAWITSVKGISAEMWPFFRMTVPAHIQSLTDLEITPGVRMFRSHVLLLGVLPVDYSDMTLLEITPGQGFVEKSPMASMHSWRHERRILPTTVEGTVKLVDELTFQPRLASRLVGGFVQRFFRHRHQVLKKNLGGN